MRSALIIAEMTTTGLKARRGFAAFATKTTKTA
jgi:hypothetical protein